MICKPEKHPLYSCPRFKLMHHDQKIEILKSNHICMNCLRPGHFLKNSKSLHRCRTCQKPHHTLLHIDGSSRPSSSQTQPPNSDGKPPIVTSNAATDITRNSLLMTCRVMVKAPDGSTVRARALLDSASSASFVSDRLVKSMCLPRIHQNITISGVAGLTHTSLQSLTNLTIVVPRSNRQFNLNAIVVPRVTCELPAHHVAYKSNWHHLDHLPLGDPDFGQPGQVDLLLGVDFFSEAVLQGRQIGPPGSPIAFETVFGWVLAGPTTKSTPQPTVTSHHTLINTSDDILRRFWEIEETKQHESSLSPEEKSVVQHFKTNHTRAPDGRFIVPLHKRPHAPPLGESRSQAVRRFLAL